MLVTLQKPGDEGYDESQALKRRRRPSKDRVIVAYHAPIAHYLGLPCVYLMPKADWRRYPFVHERNLVSILNHESVHCLLLRLGEVAGNDGLDNLFGFVGDL